MNTTEKYIYTVYKENSFSVAANKLFISQPALSATIKKHETKLGYQIFNRQTSPITLTEAGKVYIEYLKELLQLEKSLNQKLSKIGDDISNELIIGGSKSVIYNVIPKLCKEISSCRPDINITIDVGENAISNVWFDKLNKDRIDLLITTNYTASEFSTLELFEEKYIIVVRKDYPNMEKLSPYALTYDEVLSGEIPPEKEITDWDVFKTTSFFKNGENSKSRKIFSDFYKKTTAPSCHILHFHNLNMHYELMLEGLGAIIIPQSTALNKGYDGKNLSYFSLAIPNNTRKVMLLYKKSSTQKPYLNEVISLARKLYPKK